VLPAEEAIKGVKRPFSGVQIWPLMQLKAKASDLHSGWQTNPHSRHFRQLLPNLIFLSHIPHLSRKTAFFF